ncbi:BLOC-2 complex member HPS3 [Bombina bombina]|uniref:BLOC-2 complex member HPS3 n=1 Tax=Bombina bombina TaxID=8345 RepID=UPI00235AE1D5|nr:BLOC-2 complex member HPS3 [Bombina bombina]XP_053565969.1 BLOC-2 complex member HPS3 [Bombina bombina]
MVQLYNCHPFGSQRIVPTKQMPELFCCGQDCVFVTCAGGCKVEVFTVCQDLCQLLCSFNTLGKVVHMTYSEVGDYLVTIEERNNISSLRAYTNWRCESSGNSRVSVRMIGLNIESPHTVASKDQMEIIEMPLSEKPQCISCCPIRGDLLVGCETKLMIFCLKYLSINDFSVLDFDRSVIIHVAGIIPLQVSFCAGYIAILNDLEVFVLRLNGEPSEGYAIEPQIQTEEQPSKQKDFMDLPSSHPAESDDFVMCLRPIELVGGECNFCGITVTTESIGLSTDFQYPSQVHHILYRRFAPDFSEGIHVEHTRLHSLQLLPMYKTANHVSTDSKTRTKEFLSLFCFFSMPQNGFLYTIGNGTELISVYQYPEKSQQAVLTPQLLHVITSNNLQCFTVRCSAIAAREEDPYIDTTMKTCPPVSLNICTLRMQLFIGLVAIAYCKNHIIILTKANIEDMPENGKYLKRLTSKNYGSVKKKPPADTDPSWNLYAVSITPTIHLYKEMVEYSKRYETVMSQGSIHLLSEAHLLLRAALMDPNFKELPEKGVLEAAFRESCAYLADCYSKLDTQHSHLALPYYKMSCLSMADIINRVIPSELLKEYGKGFMFYLKHSLFEDLDDELSEEMALKVLHIFKTMDQSQLPHVLCSPCMKNVCPKKAMDYLQNLNPCGPSALVSLAKATMALKMQDCKTYEAELQRHSEMQLLCGFLDEPRLLIKFRSKDVISTEMAFHLMDTMPGLLVVSVVALHENSKINLQEAERFFKVLCEKDSTDNVPQLLVDFWEALLSTYPPESILQDILFKLTSHYVWKICNPQHSCVTPLKSPEDLRNSCSHFGLISPWITKMTSSDCLSCETCGDLLKLQSLLCGPSMEVESFLPFLNFIPEDSNSSLSIHIICATRLMDYEKSIDTLLDRCPEAVISYAKHEIKEGRKALWWNKLLPELYVRIRRTGRDDKVFISSLRDTLDVISMELDLQDFLNVLPDDGTAAFFLPYLLNQRKLLT